MDVKQRGKEMEAARKKMIGCDREAKDGLSIKDNGRPLCADLNKRNRITQRYNLGKL